MTQWIPFEALVWGFVVVAFISANLPWLSERIALMVLPKNGTKGPWTRIFEWFGLYILAGLIGKGLEFQATGGIHSQGWEFYVITLSLFAMFALPGYIWRYDLRPHLRTGERRTR
ncbi:MULTISPECIES: DUF2818 family protein [unclassified Thioalkalivibrio]|uniref:DUF2818 family protein n=1 Tax=unclassified Thioalkalivibrio TaxID=2621013 RepID=UPI0003783BBB|nr:MULTISPECIES: DUF2818 family protein [unclassified Thioalkalivibrio]